MKRYILLALFLLSNLIFSKSYENMYKEFSQKIMLKKHIDLYAIDYTYSDYFLVNNVIEKEAVNEFLIILPDVRLLEENIQKISKLGKDVIVFLLDKKSEKLKNRSIEELKTSKLANNIQILEVSVRKEDEESLINGLNDNSIYFTEYFKKVFYEKYKNVSRYDYMGVLKR